MASTDDEAVFLAWLQNNGMTPSAVTAAMETDYTSLTPERCARDGGCFGLPAGLPLKCYDASRMSKTTPPVRYKSSLDMLICATHAAASDPVATARAEAAQQARARYAAECPWPIPGYFIQQEDTKICRPAVAIYDAPCSDKVVDCVLFKKMSYRSLQQRLTQLLSAMPSPNESRAPQWCTDVLTTVSRALDATNVRSIFFRPWANTPANAPEGVNVFGSIDTFREKFKTRVQAQLGRAIREPIVFPAAPSLGGDLLGSQQTTLPVVGTVAGPWVINPVRSGFPHRTRIISNTMRDASPIGSGRPVYESRNFASVAQYIELVFQYHKGNDIAPALYKWRQTMDKSIFGYVHDEEWRPCFLVTGSLFIEWCAEWAKLIVSTSLETIVSEALMNWLGQIAWFASMGAMDVPPDQVATFYTDLARDRARAMQGEVSSTASAVSNVGGLVGKLFFTVFNFISAILVEILPMAAGWSCPQPPFKRTTKICELTNMQGVDVQEIQQQVNRVAAAGNFKTPWDVPPGPGGPTLPDITDLLNNEEQEGAQAAKYIVGGAVFVGGALLLRHVLTR